MKIIRAEWVCPWCIRIKGPWHWLIAKAGICPSGERREISSFEIPSLLFDPAGRPCPRCGFEIPEESEETGDGAVWLKADGRAYCSMECALEEHEELLKRQ